MFAGHFGLAAAVKAKVPEVPLWALMAATQLIDIAFVPLLLSGTETMEAAEGTGYGGAVIHADYTHSLVGVLLLAVLAGLAARRAWGKKGGITIGAVVLSHWLLDLLVHRPDLPILPGNAGGLPLLGLGLWNFPQASAVVELALIAVGLFLYVRSLRHRSDTRGKPLRARAAGAAMAALLILSLAADYFGI